MTEVILANDRALANPFAAYAEEASSTNTIRGDLLKFTKGRWSLGQNNTRVPDGTTYTVDMNEILVGWQRWWDRRVTAATMGTVASGFRVPPRDTLGDTDKGAWETDVNGKPQDPWQLTSVVYMTDGDGDEVTFSTSSHGGRNAVAALCKEYGAHMKAHPGASPIVAIGGDEYDHREYGLTFTPTLKIVGWTDDEGDALPAAKPEAAAPAASKGKARF